MKRFPLLVLTCLVGFNSGCSDSAELERLRLLAAREKKAAAAANAETARTRDELRDALRRSESQLTEAEAMRDAAAKMKSQAEASELRAKELLAQGKSERAIAQQDLVEAERARSAASEERQRIQEERSALRTELAKVEQRRAALVRELDDAREVLDRSALAQAEAQKKQAELSSLKSLVEEMVAQAHEDRRIAEEARNEAKRKLDVIVAERKAARQEQAAAADALAAAAAEKSAATAAMEAAQVAKQDAAQERGLLEERQKELTALQERLERQRFAAEQAIADANAAKLQADLAQERAARQEVALQKQKAVLLATREAAETSRNAAQRAWSIATAEIAAADTAKEIATQTEQAAAKAQGYVLDVVKQLRDAGQELEVRAAQPDEDAPSSAPQSAPLDEIDALLGL